MATETPPRPITSRPDRPIERRPEFAGILRETETYSTGSSDSTGDRINGWFDRLMIQSGMGIAPSMLLAICMSAAVVVGFAFFVFSENLLIAGIGAVIGGMLPLGFALMKRARRQRLIMRQMPDMIEELSRAARTGRSLEQSLAFVADDTPAPLGDEIKRVSGRLAMGLPMRDALDSLPERTGVISLSVFALALKIHQETGGDLVRVLDRLSQAVRDRVQFLGRLRAATISFRLTATLMLSVPPLILLFFIFRDPNYLSNLFASPWGRTATLIAIGLQIIGVIWIVRILRDSSRN